MSSSQTLCRGSQIKKLVCVMFFFCFGDFLHHCFVEPRRFGILGEAECNYLLKERTFRKIRGDSRHNA